MTETGNGAPRSGRRPGASPAPARAHILAVTASLVAALSLSAGDLPSTDAETIDLILVAGQSNAVGFDTNAAGLAPSDSDASTHFWFRCGDPPADDFDSTSGGAWTLLRAQPRGTPNGDRMAPRQFGNFSQPGGGFGAEIGLSRAWHETNPGRGLAIVKTAFNATRLAYDWQPGANGERGESYRALVSEVKLAMQTAETKGLKLRLRALIWIQGEGDASAADAPEYEGRLRALIAALRRDLDSPDLEVLLSVNSKYERDGEPYIIQIVSAQKSVASSDPRVVYVDTASATVANRSHFDSAGMLEVGRLLAEALDGFACVPVVAH